MRYTVICKLLGAVLLTSSAGCATRQQQPAVQVVGACPRVPDPPPEVINHQPPDYLTWLERILSGSPPAPTKQPTP